MPLLLRSAIIWLGAFLALELPGKFWKNCPWTTLSDTVWLGIKWWSGVGAITAALMFILYGHFEDHWKVRYLIAAAVLGVLAIVAHVIEVNH